MSDGTGGDAYRCPAGAAVQDHYPEKYGQCYGCGRFNEEGLHIRSCWSGEEETVAYFTPRPEHRALPGIVYGGLIASLVDCHSTGSAAAAIYREEGRSFDTLPPIRCVTAALHVDYLRPTPLDSTIEVRGRIKEIKGRKVVVTTTVSADGEVCARGEVVAIRVPPEDGD